MMSLKKYIQENYMTQVYHPELRMLVGGFCTLCANHGIIDNTGLKSPNGIIVGRKQYCLCDNGMASRRNKVLDEIQKYNNREIIKEVD